MLTTIVPLWDAGSDLHLALPYDLDYGFQIRNMSRVLGAVDLSLWSRYVAPEQQKKITDAGICLTHEYVGAKPSRSRVGPLSSVAYVCVGPFSVSSPE
jgi:hypothetical protein